MSGESLEPGTFPPTQTPVQCDWSTCRLLGPLSEVLTAGWASFTQAEIPVSLTAALSLLAFGHGQPNGVTAHFPPVRVVTSGQGVRMRGSCAEDHKPQSHSSGPCGCLAPEQSRGFPNNQMGWVCKLSGKLMLGLCKTWVEH